MKKYFIIGGIGAGKTSACEILSEKYNVPVIDLDDIGHDVLKNENVVRRVSEVFDNVVDRSGSVNRIMLAEAAFGSPESTEKLNEIMFDGIVEEFHLSVDRIDGDKVIVEASSLRERDPRFIDEGDFVLAIATTYGKRIARKRARGMDIDDIIKRNNVQITDEDRATWADKIISNDGLRTAFSEELCAWWEQQ